MATDQLDAVNQLELPAGPLRYREAGAGPPLVFVHGYLVDGRLWDPVIEALAARFRCICPDWPLGAQRLAMKPDADLSPPGIAALISAFLAALDLDDGDDRRQRLRRSDVAGSRHQPSGANRAPGPHQLRHARELSAGDFQGDAADRPLPGGIELLSAPFRIPAVARAAYRPFARTQIPAELIASWLQPSLSDRGGPAPTCSKVTIGLDKRYTLAAAEKLRRFDRRRSPRLGTRRSATSRSNTPSGSAAIRPMRAWLRSPTPRPSSRSISPRRLGEEIAEFLSDG